MFKIDKNVERWCYHLINKKGLIKTEFDLFYIFLLVGLGFGRSEKIAPELSKVFTKVYPKGYEPSREKIASLLLYTDLKTTGFDTSNKSIVKSKIVELFSSNSQTYLSDIGIEKLNSYANGGYRLIKEKILQAPSDSTNFLIIISEEFLDDLYMN